LTKSAETNIKILMAKVVVAAMDVRDVSRKPRKLTRLNRPRSQERLKGIFRLVNGDIHSLFN